MPRVSCLPPRPNAAKRDCSRHYVHRLRPVVAMTQPPPGLPHASRVRCSLPVHPHPGGLQHQLRTEHTNPTREPGGLSIGDSPAAYRAFVNHPISQFNYAFFSKFLYFTSDRSQPAPRCLILDERVATALRTVTGKSYIPNSAGRRPAAYADYCRDVHRWSIDYGCYPDDIEWRLYRFGQLIGSRERWLRAEVSL